MKKKPYVPPRLTRVKLEPSQAVLGQCAADATDPLRDADIVGCSPLLDRDCRQASRKEDSAISS